MFTGLLRTLTIVLAALMPLALGACASKVAGTPFTNVGSVTPGKSAIYFYRLPDETNAGGLRDIYLNIDNQPIGTLPYGGYLKREVDPGNHNVSAKSETLVVIPLLATAVEAAVKTPETVNIQTGSGTTTYVRLRVNRDFFTFSVTATVVPEQQAVFEMKDTNSVK